MAVAQSGTSGRPGAGRRPGHTGATPPAPEGSELVDEELVVALAEPSATHPLVAGRKAANLATALGLGFPVLGGFVITTAGCGVFEEGRADGKMQSYFEQALRQSWTELSDDGKKQLVVRSSSPGEDTGTSSMAGQFTSVLGVQGWDNFLDAVETVINSARVVDLDQAERSGVGPMAVLVQPQVFPAWGGVMFGVDPVTGATDRLVVAVVQGGPDQLVSGTVDGGRMALSHHGRDLESEGDVNGFPATYRKALAHLAAKAARVFGGPQDIEWAIEEADGTKEGHGRLLLLQSRPVTASGTTASAKGPILGPGPVAETFPDPLSPLEQDLWVRPLHKALSEAVQLTGTVSRRRLRSSPVIACVGGRVAADLELLGVATGRRSLFSRFDPRPPARRLRAAWRTGRLRAALPDLAGDLVVRADNEMASVPDLATLADDKLLALLRGSQQVLVALHGYEILSGMLNPRSTGAPTSAAAALRVVADGRAIGLDDASIMAGHPVTLALSPPCIGVRKPLPKIVVATNSAPDKQDTTKQDNAKSAGDLSGEPDRLAVLREELRLRVRWVQELTVRISEELGARLARRNLLDDPVDLRWLRFEELEGLVAHEKTAPADLDARRQAVAAAPLPTTFRLSEGGDVVLVDTGTDGKAQGEGQGAGGGRAMGRVRHGAQLTESGVTEGLQKGDILIVRTLDPDLAGVLPLVGGLVSETGSVLSHLAILARELGVPTVVGVTDALSRFEEGTSIVIDGTTGEVSPVDAVVPVGE